MQQQKLLRKLKRKSKMSNITIFKNKQIRNHYVSDKEVWYFYLVDIVEAASK